MRKLILHITILLSLLPSATMAGKSMVFISGRVKQYNNREITITTIKDFLYNRRVNVGSTVTDENGMFQISVRWDKPWLAEMSFGDKTLQIFLAPGDSIKFVASYSNLHKSIKYLGKSGKGYNLLKAYIKKYKSHNNSFNKKMRNWDGEEFVLRNDENHNEQLNFISKDSLKKENKYLYAYLRAQVDYTYLNNIFEYCGWKNKFFPQAYMDSIVTDQLVNNDLALPAVIYLEFLENYLSWKCVSMRKEIEVSNNYWDYRYKVCKAILNANARDLMLARILKKAFEYTFHVTAMNLFYDYETMYLNAGYYNEIKKNFLVK